MSEAKTVHLTYKKILPPALCLIVVIIALFAQCGFLAFPQKNGTYLSEAGLVVSIDDFDICNGEIYISNDDPGRIQVFDMDGNFLRGYYIPCEGSRSIRAESGRLTVFSWRDNYAMELNRDGTVQKEYVLPSYLWNKNDAPVASVQNPGRYSAIVCKNDQVYASENLLGFCTLYDLTNNAVIFRNSLSESIPLFITYLALFACIGWLAVRIAMAAWQKAQLKSEND